MDHAPRCVAGRAALPGQKGRPHRATGHDRPGSPAAPPVPIRSRSRAAVLAARSAPLIRRGVARRRRRHQFRAATRGPRQRGHNPALRSPPRGSQASDGRAPACPVPRRRRCWWEATPLIRGRGRGLRDVAALLRRRNRDMDRRGGLATPALHRDESCAPASWLSKTMKIGC